MKIGERLRELREAKGLNQKQLAQVAGLDDATISHLEKNKRGITLEQATKLAAIFEMTIDELLHGEVETA
jgi:putative transcriptional regulator